ncbi:12192_t:CDS:1, partial [Racocetra fulgida]
SVLEVFARVQVKTRIEPKNRVRTGFAQILSTENQSLGLDFLTITVL